MMLYCSRFPTERRILEKLGMLFSEGNPIRARSKSGVRAAEMEQTCLSKKFHLCLRTKKMFGRLTRSATGYLTGG